jgi:hypothetical protein
MNNSTRKPPMSKDEFVALWKDMSREEIDYLWGVFLKAFTDIQEQSDWSAECSMCGKQMSYRYCGMCTHCEMVWNG